MPKTNITKANMSFWAKFFYTRVSLQLSTCVYVGVQYNKLPELSELYAALGRLVEENPPLGVNIFADGNVEVNCNEIKTKNGLAKPDPPQDVYAAQLKEINFSQVVEDMKHLDIHDYEAVKTILQRRFEYGNFSKPLWRVHLLKDNWLVFCYDHAFLDGMSGANTQKKLAVILNEMAKSSETFQKNAIFELKPYSAADNLGIINIYKAPENTWGFATRQLLDSRVYPILKSSAKTVVSKLGLSPAWLGRLHTFQSNPKYVVQKNHFIDNYQNVNISAKDTNKLIQLGKKNGSIGLNSLITALISVSTKNAYVQEEQSVPFHFAISQRAKFKTDPESLGVIIKTENVVSPVLKNNLVTPSGLNVYEFWSFARGVNTEMATAIKSNNGLEKFNKLGLVDLVPSIKSKEGETPTLLFYHSNLSLQFQEKLFRDDDDLKYTIKNAVFNQSQVFSNNFTVSSIATVDGGINLQITYPDELIAESENVILNFNTYYKDLLKSLK